MADSSFLRSPVQTAVSAELGRIEARREARAAPKPPADPRASFEQASEQYQVPANLLMALGEASGLDPAEFASTSGQLAEALGKSIGSGRRHSEAIREVLPGAPAGFEKQIVDRSNALYDELYAPQDQAPPEAPDDGGIGVVDAAATLGSSINRSIGSAVRGAGELIAKVGDLTSTAAYNAATGEDVQTPNALAPIADAIQAWAAKGSTAVSEESAQAVRDSSPDGDLFRPSTWKLGDAPSVRGYTMLAFDVFGSLVPVVAASILGAGPAAVVGGATGGGAGAEQAGQVIDQMAAETGEDGRSKLEAESAYYRDLIAAGMTPERAQRRTRVAAQRMAALWTTPVSAAGGALTAKILHPANAVVAAGGRLTRAAGTAALSGVEEGVQGVAESAAGRAGMNAAAGTDESLTEGTFGDFLLGALAGGAPGAVAGAVGGQHSAAAVETAAEPEEEAPRALPSPTGGGTIIPEVDHNEDERLYREGERIGLEIEAAKAAGASLGEVRELQAQLGEISAERARLAAEREGVAPPPAPKGPIGEALARGPAPIAPDMRSGDSIVIEPEGVSPIHGLFLGESPTGLRVRDEDGQELEIPREEIEAGTTRISLGGAQGAEDSDPAPAAAQDDGDFTDPGHDGPQDMVAPEVVPDGAPAAPDDAAPQTIVADPAPAAQPVQGGLADAAAQAAQQSRPRVEAEPQADQFDLLQKRLAIITDQARTSGWNKRLTALRDKTEAAIAALTPPAEPEAPKTAEIATSEPPAAAADPVTGEEDATFVEANWDKTPAPSIDEVGPQPVQAVEPTPAETEQPSAEATIEPAADVTTKSGKPFADRAQAMRAFRSRGLDPEAHDIVEVEGGLVARPRAAQDAASEIELQPTSGDHVEAQSEPEPAVEIAPSTAQVDEIAPAEAEAKKPAKPKRLTPRQQHAADEAARSDYFAPGNIVETYSGGHDRVVKYSPAGPDGSGWNVTVEAVERDGEGWRPAPGAARRTHMTRPDDRALQRGPLERAPTKSDEITAAAKETAPEPQGQSDSAALLEQFEALGRRLIDLRQHLETLPSSPERSAALREVEAEMTRNQRMTSEIHQEKINARLLERSALSRRATAQQITAAAAEADPEPTDGQKEAGNYKLGHTRVHGLDISIENAKGSTRRGTAPDGQEWSVEMPAHYGYFRRTEGADGDHVDVYIGEDPDSDRAFIVDQFDPKTGKLDEHKTVLGVRSAEEALSIYDAGFSDGSGPARRRNMDPTEMSVDEFKAWLSNGDQTKPAQDTEGEKAPAPAAAPQAEPTGQHAPAAAAPASPAAETQNPEPPRDAAAQEVASAEEVDGSAAESEPTGAVSHKGSAEDLSARASADSQVADSEQAGNAETPAQPREPDGRFASPEIEVEPGRLIEGDGSAFSISYEPPTKGFRDATSLRGHLTRGPLGEVIGKLIHAGKVVLHETEETLPEAGSKSLADDMSVWRTALAQFLQGKRPPHSDLPVGRVPAVLHALRVPAGLMVMRAGKVRKVVKDHADIGESTLVNLPAFISDPIAVFRQSGKESDLLLVTKAKNSKGVPVVVAVKSQGFTSTNLPATVVLTVYAPDKPDLTFGSLLASGPALYEEKNGSAAGLVPTGVSSHKGPSSDRQTVTPSQKILTKADLVKKSVGEPAGFLATQSPLQSQRGDQESRQDGSMFVLTSDGKPIRSRAQAARKLRALGMDSTDYDLKNDGEGFVATPKVLTPAGPIQGMTTPDGVIHLVARNLNAQTAMPVLMHEAFHAGVEPLVGVKGWQVLVGQLEAALSRAEAQRRAGESSPAADFWDAALRRIDAANVPPEQRAEEFAAYAIEEAEKAPAGIRGFIDRLLGKVKAFLLSRFGHQLGVVTPNELRALAMGALRNGTVGTGRGPRGGARQSVAPRTPEAPSARPGAMIAPNIPALTAEQMAELDRGVISSALTKAMEGGAGGKISILGLVPGRPLFAELSKKMPAAQEYLALKTDMDALRNQWHARTDETAQAWRTLVGKDSAANAKLMEIMHEATLLGADPSKPYNSTLTDKDRMVLALPGRGQAYRIAVKNQAEDAERHAAWAKLRKRLRGLPADFQAMFEKVRDDYVALNTAFDEAIIENAGRAIDAALRRAERTHEEEMTRIRDEGLTGKEQAEAEAEANRRLASTKYRVRTNRRARMADLRAEFETKKIAAPYFPLARFGSFFVTTRDAETGQVLGFSTFESPKAQQAFVKEQAADPAHKVEAGTLGETSVRDMVDHGFVQAVEKILIDANMPEAILDAVWQQWLQTMPDLSLRKKRIHRKGTPGFSSDAFRAFGHHMFHGSHQLARLRYAITLDEALEIAGAQAKAQPDPIRAGLIVEEMKRRHEFTMNPKGAWWSQAVTSAAFIWYLAMSPAAAIVNLSQTSIMGPPILGAAFPEAGVRGAARELTRALHDFSRGLATWRPGKGADDTGTVGASGRLSEEEKAAMEEAYRRGTVDKSQAHDLAGVGETGVEYSATRAKIMGVVSWAFHHTERLNREVTFLAAYRMARAAKLNHHDAIDRASDVTWRTHFDYQGSSRPRVMQGDAAKVLLVFRNFQVNMLWRLVRDVHQSINAKDKAERKEALTQLAGITGMLFLNGGIRGVWGFGLAMSILGMFFAGGSDDAEDEMKKAVVAALGVELGGMVLNGVPGHLTRTDLTSRVGMPDLWFRSSDRIVEGEDAYNYWLGEFLGAGFGMAERAFRGGDLLMKGEFQRGIETLLPKGLRDIARAGRYAMDGVTTLKGDEIVPDVAAGEVLRQALGFTPARVAERYGANSKMKNAETRIMDERQSIMSEVAAAVRDGGALPQHLIGRIETFNLEHPSYPITMASLRTSLRSRSRASARMEFGIMLNPRLNDEIRGAAAPLVYE